MAGTQEDTAQLVGVGEMVRGLFKLKPRVLHKRGDGAKVVCSRVKQTALVRPLRAATRARAFSVPVLSDNCPVELNNRNAGEAR